MADVSGRPAVDDPPARVVRSLLPLFRRDARARGALTAMCFVKVYGIAFLGRPREPADHSPLPHRRGRRRMERYGMPGSPPAASCSGSSRLHFSDPQSGRRLADRTGFVRAGAAGSGWLWLVPTSAGQASYSPVIFLVVIRGRNPAHVLLVRASTTGACASRPLGLRLSEQTSRMQEHRGCFPQPIRHVFDRSTRIERRLPGPDDYEPRYTLKVEDAIVLAVPARGAGGRFVSSKSRCCSRAGSASTCSTASSP